MYENTSSAGASWPCVTAASVHGPVWATAGTPASRIRSGIRMSAITNLLVMCRLRRRDYHAVPPVDRARNADEVRRFASACSNLGWGAIITDEAVRTT